MTTTIPPRKLPPPCFDLFVGLRAACDAPDPASGLWLDDLPGLDLRQAALAASGETETGAELLARSLNRGLLRLADDFKAALGAAGWQRFREAWGRRTAGAFSETYLPPAPGLKGLRFKRSEDLPLSRIYLRKVWLLADATVAGAPLELRDGPETHVLSVDLTAGQPAELPLHYQARNPEVYLLWDTATLPVNDSAAPKSGGSCGCRPPEPLQIDGWDGAKASEKTFGMRAEAGFWCDEWELLCDLRPALGGPARLAAGIAFMEARLHSDRLTALGLDPDDARALLEDWRTEYARNIRELAARLPGLARSYGDDCIACRSGRAAFWTP